MRVSDVIIGALKNPLKHKVGRCTICGNPSIFICTSMKNHGNSMYCPFCVSSTRKRHVALALLEAFGRKERSIAHIPVDDMPAVYNTDAGDSFARILNGRANYSSSVYRPDIKLGVELKPGLSCQNLESLSFENASFDVVITEEVFEHVRHYEEGFKEVYRVLKPGGFHIFTIPFNAGSKTVARVDTSKEEDKHILPPHYHGDKLRGEILVYTDFGHDLFDLLETIGFETKVRSSSYFDHRWGVFDSRVFVSQKASISK